MLERAVALALVVGMLLAWGASQRDRGDDAPEVVGPADPLGEPPAPAPTEEDEVPASEPSYETPAAPPAPPPREETPPPAPVPPPRDEAPPAPEKPEKKKERRGLLSGLVGDG